ncbi:hypothetical protein LY622_16770 [Halomonas sp. M5N1S17]|uniref:hypothetical protein n=1 Tax=Halomonas alkalisoli TaxID=2907158 RepID=UPI001F424BC4|nr:hypothetical protein [Halomonas alkalisoli]MCE9665084.1 hypothetical protein [Halomonas alkalisoli]
MSELELPELTPAPPCAEPDIEILTPGQLGPLDDAVEDWPCLELDGERCQILVQGIGRYRIEQGRRILVDRRVPREPEHQVVSGDVRLYLLGAALGILLHQRQCLPLHVSAVHTPAGVWAFTGDSGAGKSTLAAWLHQQHGWPLVSDDVAVIEPDAPEPILHPGPPRLKLWQDALAAMAIDTSGLVRDLTRADKYHLNAHAGFRDEAGPLKVLVELERAEPGEVSSLTLLKGVDAFRVLLRALYRAELGRLFNPPARLLATVSALASQIQVYRFRRPWSLERMDASLAPLMQEIEASRFASPDEAGLNER